MTMVEKWNEVYLVLFPGADPTCLPSPFYEYPKSDHAVGDSTETEFSRYEQFLGRELPSHVKRELELCIEERLNPIEESLRSQLVDIIRDAQIHLLSTYRSLRSSTPAVSAGEPVQGTSADAERVAHLNEELHQVGDGLQAVHQPPLLDDAQTFADFNGLMYDLSGMPQGSVDLNSGHWSVAPASKDGNELGFLSGEFGS
ncbi:hypothetical protein LY76DRAFT_676665 [Colletotrichum caudatum]|nr:hypothetical protein LY76DRAFT_676665 [Colletotrichum caudatum]